MIKCFVLNTCPQPQAEARCQAAEQETQAVRASIARLKREAADLQRANSEIKQQLLLRSSWGGAAGGAAGAGAGAARGGGGAAQGGGAGT